MFKVEIKEKHDVYFFFQIKTLKFENDNIVAFCNTKKKVLHYITIRFFSRNTQD